MKFLTHEAIAAGCFSRDYSCHGPSTAAWCAELTASDEALMLLTARMEKDWVSLHPKMRRTWGLKEVAPWLIHKMTHSLSGQGCTSALRLRVPGCRQGL